MAPILFLVRHASTQTNEEARIRAWTNPSISEDAIPTVKRSAEAISYFPLKGIVTSDLKRCKQTAGVIAEVCFLEIVDDMGLRPWNLGEMGGQKIADVQEEIERLRAEPNRPAPGGEPYNEFLQRYKRCWKRLLRASIASPDEHLVVITHARNIGLARFFELGDKSALKETANPLNPGEVTSWRYRGGKWIEVQLTKTSQLSKDKEKYSVNNVSQERRQTNP